ncbi:hypothetical protein [Hymenobacter mucosus]|uniref:Uncharacterized protein n=1 Tax=Hymenobacter mucosus TaxID=1411120 RepID=A0A238V6R1_9BACT|nr:hypothetical protein [Hymenobacter mucosus]SNR30112.1 hypothetical protein SAMN06269173_101233 [Hymenobacter mucosus]
MSLTTRLFGTVALIVGMGSAYVLGQRSRPVAPTTIKNAQASPQTQVGNHNPRAGRRVATPARKDSMAAWTRRFRQQYPALPKAYYINAKLVREILSQEQGSNPNDPKGGMRLYFGLDSARTPHVILVGVRENGTNVLEPKRQVPLRAGFILGESATRCPDNCDRNSPLEQ